MGRRERALRSLDFFRMGDWGYGEIKTTRDNFLEIPRNDQSMIHVSFEITLKF
jgi:hypothetical protein